MFGPCDVSHEDGYDRGLLGVGRGRDRTGGLSGSSGTPAPFSLTVFERTPHSLSAPFLTGLSTGGSYSEVRCRNLSPSHQDRVPLSYSFPGLRGVWVSRLRGPCPSRSTGVTVRCSPESTLASELGFPRPSTNPPMNPFDRDPRRIPNPTTFSVSVSVVVVLRAPVRTGSEGTE